jgi:hypothetical protein
MFIFRTERCIKKQHCRLLKEQYFPVQLGTDHLTSRGGLWFFSKKNILIPNFAEKNILVEEKK